MITPVPAGTNVIEDMMAVAGDEVKGMDPLTGLAPTRKTLAVAAEDRPAVLAGVKDFGDGGRNREEGEGKQYNPGNDRDNPGFS
jgi:hypothetical protein